METTTQPVAQRNGIGILNESSLHAALIASFAETGDRFEEMVDGYSIDITKENLLVEIQTRNFNQIQRKIVHLSKERHVRLIHPIAEQKWIIKSDQHGKNLSRRKSPKRGRVEEVFIELARAREIFTPNVSLWIALINLEEVWINDGLGSWRRKKWSIQDRRLMEINNIKRFNTPNELLMLLPENLVSPFTNQDLSATLQISPRLASQMTYTLRKMNLLDIVGKKGRANLHTIR